VQVHGEFSLVEVLAKFGQLRDERVLKSEELGWGSNKGDAQVRTGCQSTDILLREKVPYHYLKTDPFVIPESCVEILFCNHYLWREINGGLELSLNYVNNITICNTI